MKIFRYRDVARKCFVGNEFRFSDEQWGYSFLEWLALPTVQLATLQQIFFLLLDLCCSPFVAILGVFYWWWRWRRVREKFVIGYVKGSNKISPFAFHGAIFIQSFWMLWDLPLLFLSSILFVSRYRWGCVGCLWSSLIRGPELGVAGGTSESNFRLLVAVFTHFFCFIIDGIGLVPYYILRIIARWRLIRCCPKNDSAKFAALSSLQRYFCGEYFLGFNGVLPYRRFNLDLQGAILPKGGSLYTPDKAICDTVKAHLLLWPILFAAILDAIFVPTLFLTRYRWDAVKSQFRPLWNFRFSGNCMVHNFCLLIDGIGLVPYYLLRTVGCWRLIGIPKIPNTATIDTDAIAKLPRLKRLFCGEYFLGFASLLPYRRFPGDLTYGPGKACTDTLAAHVLVWVVMLLAILDAIFVPPLFLTRYRWDVVREKYNPLWGFRFNIYCMVNDFCLLIDIVGLPGYYLLRTVGFYRLIRVPKSSTTEEEVRKFFSELSVHKKFFCGEYFLGLTGFLPYCRFGKNKNINNFNYPPSKAFGDTITAHFLALVVFLIVLVDFSLSPIIFLLFSTRYRWPVVKNRFQPLWGMRFTLYLLGHFVLLVFDIPSLPFYYWLRLFSRWRYPGGKRWYLEQYLGYSKEQCEDENFVSCVQKKLSSFSFSFFVAHPLQQIVAVFKGVLPAPGSSLSANQEKREEKMRSVLELYYWGFEGKRRTFYSCYRGLLPVQCPKLSETFFMSLTRQMKAFFLVVLPRFLLSLLDVVDSPIVFAIWMRYRGNRKKRRAGVEGIVLDN